jgi:hypothetical protein
MGVKAHQLTASENKLVRVIGFKRDKKVKFSL